MERFKVGILGAGRIAEKMAWTLTQMSEAQPYAVASRDLGKAQAFAQKYGITAAYGSYEDMLNDPQVELIYVATPHSFHHAHVRMCLEKGKPVLCEKAFMLNRAQAQDVIDLATESGIVILRTEERMYVACGRLYENGLRGGGVKGS